MDIWEVTVIIQWENGVELDGSEGSRSQIYLKIRAGTICHGIWDVRERVKFPSGNLQ